MTEARAIAICVIICYYLICSEVDSGFFHRHELSEKYKYYWRVEPGVSFHCDLDFCSFSFMQKKRL